MRNVAKTWLNAIQTLRDYDNTTLPNLVVSLAEQYSGKPALISETDSVTYVQLATRMERYARWAIKAGMAGHTVAMMMDNSVDYVILWLALTRVRCTVALINAHLRGAAFTHCLNVAEAKYLIVSPEHYAAVNYASIKPTLKQNLTTFVWTDLHHDKDDPRRIVDLNDLLPINPDDRALLIYTSGTTGYPKATIITHRRIIEWSAWFKGMTQATDTDRLYNCLPMYHSVGGVVAVGSMLLAGATVIVRAKFSSSRFWADINEYGCTIFQYIGELCRYLVTNSIKSPEETSHKLRLAVGNGLQADVWRRFQRLFHVPQILEFYAATEGGLSLYNVEGKVGALGRIPPYLGMAVELIEVDVDTLEPIRNEYDFCEHSRIGNSNGLLAPPPQEHPPAPPAGSVPRPQRAGAARS